MKKFKIYAPYLIVLIYLLIYILPLGFKPLFVPDETRYAEIPREMLASGNWTTPKLDGFRYFEKPVLAYWANAISIKLFGENEFAVRLPSALSAGITALLVYFFANFAFKRKRTALLASIIFLMSMEVFAVGTFSVTDMMLTMLLTGTLVFFYLAAQSENIKMKILHLAICSVFCGGAFLVKGFLAFAIPAIVITPFLLWSKRWKEIFTLPWIPLLGIVIVSLPWCLSIHYQEASFWNYFFWVEHVNRFTSSADSQHPQRFWFFIPVLLAGAIPWTFYIPCAIRGFTRKFHQSAHMKYLLCWFIIPFLFFSISSGKLATYILPCFPALALLMALGLVRYLEISRYRLWNASSLILAALFFFTAILFPLSQLLGPKAIRIYETGEFGKLAVATVALFLVSLCFLLSRFNRHQLRKVLLAAFALVPLMLASNVVVPQKMLSAKAPGELLERNKSRVRPEDKLVAYSSIAAAAAWYFQRSDVDILHKPGEFEHGLSYEDSKNRFHTFNDFRALVEDPARKQRIILIMQHKDKRDEYVPAAKYEDVSGEYYFIEF